jgi:hypothetical protein
MPTPKSAVTVLVRPTRITRTIAEMKMSACGWKEEREVGEVITTARAMMQRAATATVEWIRRS